MQHNVVQYRYFWTSEFVQKPLDDVEASFGLVHDPFLNADLVSLLGDYHRCQWMQQLHEAGRVLDA